MNRPSMPDPGPIVRLTTAFWDSQALLTASRLKLFDQLASGPKTPEQVAAALGLDARMTGLLMRVLAGLGLLEPRDGAFVNSAAVTCTRRWLRASSSTRSTGSRGRTPRSSRSKARTICAGAESSRSTR